MDDNVTSITPNDDTTSTDNAVVTPQSPEKPDFFPIPQIKIETAPTPEILEKIETKPPEQTSLPETSEKIPTEETPQNATVPVEEPPKVEDKRDTEKVQLHTLETTDKLTEKADKDEEEFIQGVVTEEHVDF